MLKLILGLTLGLGVAWGAAARAQSSVPPAVTAYRAGEFCVFVGPTGIAVVSYLKYDSTTYMPVACPQLGDPGFMLLPSIPEPSRLDLPIP